MYATSPGLQGYICTLYITSHRITSLGRRGCRCCCCCCCCRCLCCCCSAVAAAAARCCCSLARVRATHGISTHGISITSAQQLRLRPRQPCGMRLAAAASAAAAAAAAVPLLAAHCRMLHAACSEPVAVACTPRRQTRRRQPKMQSVQLPWPSERGVRARRVTHDCLRRVCHVRRGAVCVEWCVQQVQGWKPREHSLRDAVLRVRAFRDARAAGASKQRKTQRATRVPRAGAACSRVCSVAHLAVFTRRVASIGGRPPGFYIYVS